VTCFLAGSSSFSWHDLAGIGDNHLATLLHPQESSQTGCPRTQLLDFISNLACSYLGVESVELVYVAENCDGFQGHQLLW